MSNYRLPGIPAEVENAYRAAHRALESIVSPVVTFVPEAELHVTEVISQFPSLAEGAEMVVAAELGPQIVWRTPHAPGEFALAMGGIDLDEASYDFAVTLDESAYQGGDSGCWQGSPLDRAARVYKREAGWDFTPGDAGIWLLMLAPAEAFGGGNEDNSWQYHGYLAGFVILYDRDKDGTYEAVGHIWTARSWRRQGIARRLLDEARTRFHTRHVERPYTAAGAALVEAAWNREAG